MDNLAFASPLPVDLIKHAAAGQIQFTSDTNWLYTLEQIRRLQNVDARRARHFRQRNKPAAASHQSAAGQGLLPRPRRPAMNPPHFHNPNQCPLCGAANDCQLCSPAAYKGPCWCARVEMPAALLARVPENFRNRACICRDCVEKFQREQRQSATPAHRAVRTDSLPRSRSSNCSSSSPSSRFWRRCCCRRWRKANCPRNAPPAKATCASSASPRNCIGTTMAGIVSFTAHAGNGSRAQLGGSAGSRRGGGRPARV